MDNPVQGDVTETKRCATLRSGTASLTSTACRAAFVRHGGCTGGSAR
ncbi:DUF6380 family protein [Streptomyces sp. NPDC000878]